MKKLYFLVAVLALSLQHYVTSPAHATITAQDELEGVRQQRVLEQNQERFLDELKAQQKDKARKKVPEAIDIPQPDTTPDIAADPASCFDIDTIVLEGVTVLSKGEQNDLTAAYLGSCMSIGHINALLKEIVNYYMEQGYVTTRAFIPQQNLQQGTLKLTIVEGKIEAIELNDNGFRQRMQVATAFPGMKQQILNLRAIEQGIDQMNRLQSNDATIELLPGSKPGYSVVKVTNNVQRATRFKIGYDNLGQKPSGRDRGTATFEQDNLMGINDYWLFNYTKDLAVYTSKKSSEIRFASLSIPYGYWTLSSSLSHSKYLNTITGVNQSFEISGTSTTTDIEMERVLHRNQNGKLSAIAGLVLKDSENFIEDALLESSSRKLSIVNLGVNHTTRALGGVVNTGFTYHIGSKFFGAEKDPDIVPVGTPKAQFHKFVADASFQKPLLSDTKLPVNYLGSLKVQYSPDTLYSSERLSIGDPYTVRGFKEDSLSGDSGFYLKNELYTTIKNPFGVAAVDSVLGNVVPFVALDAGSVRVQGGRSIDSQGEGYMSGWSAGIRNSSRYMDISLTYAQPIKSPAFIETEDHYIYLNVSLKFL